MEESKNMVRMEEAVLKFRDITPVGCIYMVAISTPEEPYEMVLGSNANEVTARYFVENLNKVINEKYGTKK